MPGSVDQCWTIPNVYQCVPLQRHSYSPIRDWWHSLGLYWNMGQAICHACRAVSIIFKDFTRFQIVVQNPYVKLAIQCAFIHSVINCICDIDFPYSIFPVTIFYSLSLTLFKEWECLANSFNMQCLFIPAFLLLAWPTPFVLSHCPSHHYPVAIQGICAQFFQIYSHRKINWPTYSAENVTHLNPSLPVHKASKCSDETEFQTTTWCLQTIAPVRSRAFVLRWRYCISRTHQVKNQAQRKWSNRYSQRLGPLPLFACTSWYTNSAGTIPSFTQCLPVGCIFCVFLFRNSLISIHSVENNSTRTAVVVSPNTLGWNAPMFYH